METQAGTHPPQDVAVIRISDQRYPPLLREIADPPAQLYVRGNAAILLREDLVAVVGMRQMTRYGETVAGRLAGSLACAGVPVVSGLALGIDAAAHEAVLASGGVAIAVLAAGVADNDIGPRANFGLAKRILATGGALISEFPSGTPATKEKFPLRNRIVAGLTKATVVVEAAERSGALITARLALESGRDVFAVPGPITSLASHGTNKLIASGAIPILSESSLLEALGLDSATRDTAALTDDERAVLAKIDRGATSPDAIAEATGLPPRRVAAALATLAMHGRKS